MVRELVLPGIDEHVEKAVNLGSLSAKELALWFTLFRKLDQKYVLSVEGRVRALHDHRHTGFLQLDEFWAGVHEKRSVYTDAILEHDGRVDFGEWLLMVFTYCLFEPPEIQKYVFYLFDCDKDGFFEEDELKLLLNVLQDVPSLDKLKGNHRRAFMNMEVQEDGRVELREFEILCKQFPQLFFPAFKVQANLLSYLVGDAWWRKKKLQLQDMKNARKAIVLSEAKRKRQRIRTSMGFLSYCLCFGRRERNVNSKRIAAEECSDDIEALRNKRAEEIRKMTKAAEIALKNPETNAWRTYKAKKERATERESPEAVKKDLSTHVATVSRKRSERSESREGRRQRRSAQFKQATAKIRDAYA